MEGDGEAEEEMEERGEVGDGGDWDDCEGISSDNACELGCTGTPWLSGLFKRGDDKEKASGVEHSGWLELSTP